MYFESFNYISELVNTLNEWTKAYDEGNSIVSDKEWDDKYFELKQLERETGIILGNSPTQSISYTVVNELKKVEHNHKMLSLNKTKDLTEVEKFLNKHSYVAMCKMDGLTCSLTYENGTLVSAETRGNGIIGEDILHNAMVITSIPKSIPIKEKVVIEGEIICTYENFKEFSGDYKNPRNFAAGSIRLLDSEDCARRNLTFVAWDVIEGIEEEELTDKLLTIQSFGFTIVPFLTIYLHSEGKYSSWVYNTDIDFLINKAKELGYPIDGIVYKFNDVAYGRQQGETAHHFKNAIAYKFYDEVYITHLRSIEWGMGRTGQLTPVAIFDPIEIDGSTVERASIHNISIMEEILGQPYVGQELQVGKANMIIPQIYDAVKCDNPNNPITIPSVCPICGESTFEKEDNNSTFLYCSNNNCEGKLVNRLDHFVGKKGLDIKGLSKATLEKLINWGWVNSFSDIFELANKRAEWVKKPGFGEKSVDKILEAIKYSSNCKVNNFISALGIPLIGINAAKELNKYFTTWEEFIEAVESKYEFNSLSNFGYEMSNSILSFDYSEAKNIVDKYIHFEEAKNEEKQISLEGLTFVITGKVNHFKNRDELKNYIETHGGKVVGSVSRKTNYLINNDKNSTSSKNKSAISLNIPIISEDDFIKFAENKN